MKQELWQSGQKVLKQDLARAQSTKEEAIDSRATDNFVTGIAPDLLNGMAFVVGTTSTSITVRTGVGYNSNGERLLIPSEAIAYNSANPTATTPDGIGGSTLTPKSTGTKDIPLTVASVNLLYTQYLATTDPLTFSLHKVTGQKLFTSIDDGYEIRVVNAGNVVPSTIDLVTSAPGTGGPWIFLGLVDFRVGTTVSSSMFDVSSRPLYQLNPERVVGTTPKADLSDVTPTGNYGAATAVDFDQHVKAVGSVVPTARNPHGLTLQDIGFSGKTVGTHEQYLHSSGITNGDQTANIGKSLNLKVNPRCPDRDEILVYGLSSTEFLVVQDVTLSSTDLLTTTFSFVGLSAGTYYFWANSTTKVIEKGTTAPIPSETNKFLLWTVNFSTSKGATSISSDHFLVPPSGPCSGTSNFTTLVDNRYFGNTAGDNLKRDGATDTVTIGHSVYISESLSVEDNVLVAGDVGVTGSVATGVGIIFPDATLQTTAADPALSVQGIVTGSRATGTTYHNTGTSPLYVVVSVNTNASQDAIAYVENNATPTTPVAHVSAPGGSNAGFQLFFIVLPNYYYKVTNVGSLVVWTEWY